MKKNTGITIIFVCSLFSALAIGFLAGRMALSVQNEPEPKEAVSIASAEPDVTSVPLPAPTPASTPASTPPSTLPPSPPPTETADVAPIETISTEVLWDVPSHNQVALGYNYGCEIVALAMMINYTDITVPVATLVDEMPRAQDPREGFRGNLRDSGWTIFPQALSALTTKYLGSAEDMSGCEMEDLKEKLKNETLAVVWVNGLGWPVHALCLSGYNENGFYYNDPATGEKDVFITYDDFYAIWNKQIYDSVLNMYFGPKIALSY